MPPPWRPNMLRDEDMSDFGLIDCGCSGCRNGEMRFSPDLQVHNNFCVKCGRAYCYSSGPSRLRCECCTYCFQGTCLEEHEEDDEESNIEKEPPVKKSKKVHEIPLAEQLEIIVVGVSSMKDGFPAENVLVDDKNTFWKSETMTRRNRREQFVEFQLEPNNKIRRVGSVRVRTVQSMCCTEFRLDYSKDGSSWNRGYNLWGMDSFMGISRSNCYLGNIEARLVRIVCEEDYQDEVGFSYVEFNSEAKIMEERAG